MRCGVLVAALLALAALSPLAAAQVPTPNTTPTLTIAIPDLPPGPSRVTAGQVQTIGFNVQVVASGFQCTSPGTITVDVAISNAGAAPAGVTPTIDPANLTFAVPVGVYGLPLPVGGAPEYNQSMAASLRIATSASASGQIGLSVSASRLQGQVCPPTGDLPAGSATATHAVVIAAGSGTNGTGPGPIGNNTNNTQPPPDNNPPPSKGLPGFEAAFLIAGVAVLALASRRRA